MLIQDRITSKLMGFSHYILASPLRLGAFFASLLAITFILRLREYGWVVNDDGALYLYAAKNFIDLGLAAALETYPWAYYSVLIGSIDSIFFNNLMVTGWGLNFLFQCGQIYYLYRIGCALHIRQPRLFWAIVLFIVSVSFHNFRNYIMRDQGFLLFSIAGAYYSLIFVDNKSTKSFVLFVLSFIAAALFRVEAIVLFLFGLPAVIIFTRRYSLAIVTIVFLLLGATLTSVLFSSASPVDFVQYITIKIPDIFVALNEQKRLLEITLLSEHWQDNSGIALLGLYISSYIYYLFSSLSIYFMGLFYFKKYPLNRPTIILGLYGLAIVLYCLTFLLSQGFLVFRYNLLLTYALTLLSINWVLSASARKARLATPLLILFILVSLFKVLDAPSGSKRYLLEAQDIVSEMGLAGDSVYSNSLQISLINGVDFKQGNQLRDNNAKVLKRIKSPLKKDVAVIYYGDTKTDVIHAEENCLAYYKVHRSRSISVYVANNDYCLPAKD